MLIRDFRHVAVFLLPSMVLIYIALGFYHGSFAPTELIDQTITKPFGSSFAGSADTERPTSPKKDAATPSYHVASVPATHNELSSLSTADKSYFLVSFGPGQEGAINPSIIPVPGRDGIYAIVAQEAGRGSFEFREISCLATFTLGSNALLSCAEPARALPIQKSETKAGACSGPYEVLGANVGPHDARVFWGPDTVYTVYGSNSRFGCFGQFIQNFAGLIQWDEELVGQGRFPTGMEIEKPTPHDVLEKNWFMFWDKQGDMYAHYDVRAGKRSFAKLEANGSVGPDLAERTRERDDACLARLMPPVAEEAGQGVSEAVHQATNSLAVTMCRRSDPECVAGRENTVLFTVFHHKTHRNWHSVYEPYALAFAQEAPFEVYGVGRKPLWIRGRGERDDGVTEMMFVTSISWKGKGQRYHGYLDDEMFLGFGIEDKGTGGIDVRAEDVLKDLMLCDND
jgi:hypothetical protein